MTPNIEEALRTELRGVEARLAYAEGDTKATLEARVAHIREQLGETPPPVRRARRGAESRPGDDTVETRDA